MQLRSCALIISLVIVAAFAAGCASSGTDGGSSAGADSGLSTLEPSEMVLRASDLPDGYVLAEERQTDTSLMDPAVWSVTGGYEIAFSKDTGAGGSESIAEILLVEPDGAAGRQIAVLTEEYAKQGVQPVPLSGVAIGDASTAFTVPASPQQGGDMDMIVFVKKDEVVMLTMQGSTNDFTVLESLAATAAGKIR